MKYTFILLLLLVSCKPNEKKKVEERAYTLNLPNNNITIYEYTIDGCQYLGNLEDEYNKCYLTHKGNCKNHN